MAVLAPTVWNQLHIVPSTSPCHVSVAGGPVSKTPGFTPAEVSKLRLLSSS